MFDLCHQECWDSELGRDKEGSNRFPPESQLWSIPVTCKQAEVPLNYLNFTAEGRMVHSPSFGHASNR